MHPKTRRTAVRRVFHLRGTEVCKFKERENGFSNKSEWSGQNPAIVRFYGIRLSSMDISPKNFPGGRKNSCVFALQPVGFYVKLGKV